MYSTVSPSAPQIYSRTPNPGAKFIAEQKAVLGQLGYPANDIVDTPQVGARRLLSSSVPLSYAGLLHRGQQLCGVVGGAVAC